MLMNDKKPMEPSKPAMQKTKLSLNSQKPLDADLSKKLFSIISSSYAIQKHVDFYIWLQISVRAVLPHNMLLACWGDFDNHAQNSHLNYDVSSNLTNINTQTICSSTDKIDSYMHCLQQRWVANNNRWFTVNNLDKSVENDEIKSNIPADFKCFKSLLVYGIKDVRGSNSCLYVFFSKESVFTVQDSLLGLLMPHIDNALRKIQHIEAIDVNENEKIDIIKSYNLSLRELEIIEWVKLGKTDNEIAMILFISQNTVKSHLKHVFEKLKVTRRAEAVAKLSNGLSVPAY